MHIFRPILAAALLTAVTAQAQAGPIVGDSSGASRNLSSEGTTFIHALPLSGAGAGELDQLLLSLSFDVSQNAAARNDAISLFIGGVLLASGQAAGFSVTALDVTDFFDFTTDTLTYELFRGVPLGGGNIRLHSSTLNRVTTVGFPGDGFTSEPQADVARSVPEPGSLALFGLGLLGIVGLRGVRMNWRPARSGHALAESR